MTSAISDVCALAGKVAPLRLPFRRSDEGAYGAAFPPELIEACSLAQKKKKKLPSVGALDEVEVEALIPSSATEATSLLRHDSKQVYPIALVGHLTGLLPFAYTGASSYFWYVHAESEQASIYELSVADDTLDYRLARSRRSLRTRSDRTTISKSPR